MRFSSASILAFGITACTAAAFVAKPIVVLPKTGTSQRHSSSRSVLFMAEINNDESIGFATASASEYESLGLPARSGRPLKIAIAGGGVGGLTAALCMLKKGFDVTVYEKTAAFARFGGPIQFASNALSVLKEIDDKLFDRVMDKFTFTGTRTCGIKDGRSIVSGIFLSFRLLLFSNTTFFDSGLRADGSFRMTNDSLDYLWNPEAPADWFVKFPLKECADLFGLPYTGVIDRPDLQEILIDECRAINPNFLVNGNPVTGYENMGKGDGVTVNLEDGSRVDADILVGADGIWSAVRSQMYNEGGVKSTSPDKKKRQGCTYSGYTVFAGETVLKTADYYETGYKVYIGPQRYFVTSDVGNGRIQWYAFFALPPGTKKAPSGWGGTEREGQEDPEENLVEYIKSLHEGWSSEVMTVLDSTSPDSVEQRDLYDRAPEFFRSWADGNVVLMGG
jgi:zeaxanthin epoxidase